MPDTTNGNRKIDIYVRNQYVCSTRQARNVAEAKANFLANPSYVTMGRFGPKRVQLVAPHPSFVTCKYAED